MMRQYRSRGNFLDFVIAHAMHSMFLESVTVCINGTATMELQQHYCNNVNGNKLAMMDSLSCKALLLTLTIHL